MRKLLISIAVTFAVLELIDSTVEKQHDGGCRSATITKEILHGSESNMRAALLADPELRQFFEENLRSCMDGSCDIEFKTTITDDSKGKDGSHDRTAVSTTQQAVFKTITPQTAKEGNHSSATHGKDGTDNGTTVSTTHQEVFKTTTPQTAKEEKQSTATHGKDGTDDGTAVSTTQQEVFKATTSQTAKEEKQSIATHDFANPTVQDNSPNSTASLVPHASRRLPNCSSVKKGLETKYGTSKREYESLHERGWEGYRCRDALLWYRFFDNKLAYHAANKSCFDENATLASAGMRKESIRNKVLVDYVNPFDKDSIWIGLTSDNTSTWFWADDVSSNPNNTDWHSNEPSEEKGGQCGRLWNNDNKFKIDDVPCDRDQNKFPYMCEKVFPDP